MKRSNLLFLFMCMVLLLCASDALGQNSQSYLNDIGSTAYGVNIPVENGFINISNGNLHLEFPLAAPPQRGTLRVNERLVYDSRIWMFSPFGTHGSYHWWPYNIPGTSTTSGGWQFIRGDEVGTISYNQTAAYSSPCSDSGPGRGDGGDPDPVLPSDPGDGGGGSAYDVTTQFQITWTEPNGTAHPTSAILIEDQNECGQSQPNSIMGGPAIDGSGFSIADDGTGNLLVKDNNGEEVYPQIIDRFGNYFSKDAQGNLQDDTGRVPVVVTQNGNITYYDVLSPNGNIQNNGARARYTVTTSPVSVSTNFNQSDTYEWVSGNDLTPVQSIQLPDGTQYSFTYDGYGEMSSVTLPTGGTIQYGYGNFLDSANTENRWLGSRRVGSDPPTVFSPGVWTSCSNYSTGCVEVMRVTAPSGDVSQYELTLANGAWNTAQGIFTGAPSTQCVGPIARCTLHNPLLLYTTTTYNYSNACSGTTCVGANYITSSLETTELWSNGHPSVYKQTQSTFDPTSGKPTSVKQWDYQPDSGNPNTTSAPSGVALLETDYTYTGFDPYQVITKDQNQNTVSQTTYSYTSGANPTSGVVQHGATNAGGPYLQSVQQWVNTDNSTVDQVYSFDDTGTLVSSKGQPNLTTTYHYDSANASVTDIDLPTPASGIGLGTSSTYDPGSGVLLSQTDITGAKVVYNNFDLLGRPQEIDLQDGSGNVAQKTTYTYSATQVGVHRSLTPTSSGDTETLYDAYGRPSRSAVLNGQSNTWYQQDSCYDSNGRANFQSTAYQGTGWATSQVCSGTSAGTSTTFDGLGRPLVVTNADGPVQYVYGGRDVQMTDVNNVQKIIQTDVLGRTTAVCEVTSDTSADGYQDCGLDMAGSGVLTTYSYGNEADHTTTVTQGAQTRTFITDSLGRTYTVTEPERGTTQYHYSYVSNGLQVERWRPEANQQDRTKRTHTITQYDSLGRLTSVAYQDEVTTNTPTTATKYLWYDSVPSWLGWTPTASNAKGRLAATQTNPWANTRSLYSYDIAGNIVNLWQCAPSICNSSAQASRPLAFAYDMAGNLTQENDPTSGNLSYGRSPAGEVTYIYTTAWDGAGNGPSSPYYLVSNVSNGPFGPTNWTLGNNTTAVRSYDSLGRNNGNWLCSGSGGAGQSAYCSSGQLYGNFVTTTGSRVTGMCDTVIGQCQSHTYDDFNRLRAVNNSGGPAGSYQYSYDRWGNRLTQTYSNGGPITNTWGYTNAQGVNVNQIVSSQNTTVPHFDAAGNEISDDSGNTYTYDAEGKVLTVSGNYAAQYTYDALDQRIQVATTNDTHEFLYDPFGRRTSSWNASVNLGDHGRMYWGGALFAWRGYQGQTMYQQGDWLNTERFQTDYNGSPIAHLHSLAFGEDSYPDQVTGGGAQEDSQFTGQDQDPEGTDHFLYRQYAGFQGRWMSADPYDGSYDFSDPQSFNRYSYVGNNPWTFRDPEGLVSLPPGAPTGGALCGPVCFGVILGAEAVYDLGKILGWWSHPKFTASHAPRPGASNKNWLNSDTFAVPYQGLLRVGIAGMGCEFGGCSFQNGQNGQPSDPWASGISIAISPAIWAWAHKQTTNVHGNWQYGNWCGAGGAGRPENNTDALCMVHDFCFDMTGANASAMTDSSVWAKLSPTQQGAVRGCNQALCDSVRAAPISPFNPNPRRRAANSEIPWFFTTQVPKGAGCRA